MDELNAFLASGDSDAAVVAVLWAKAKPFKGLNLNLNYMCIYIYIYIFIDILDLTKLTVIVFIIRSNGATDLHIYHQGYLQVRNC